MPDAFEELARLGEDLKRAQEVTGIAPRPRLSPVYPQYEAPRIEEACVHLQTLGYGRIEVEDSGRGEENGGDGGFLAALEAFRGEANLWVEPGRGLDFATWSMLEALCGLETEIDPALFRGADGEWLPAMRRAIRARVEELWLPKVPALPRKRDAPSPSAVEKVLKVVDFVLPGSMGLEGRALEDALVPILLSQEKLEETIEERQEEAASSTKIGKLIKRLREEELKNIGLREGLSEDDGDRNDDPPAKRTFRKLLEKRSLRRNREARAFDRWPEVAAIVEEHKAITEKWGDFLSRRKSIWHNKSGAAGWVGGILEGARQDGKALKEMIREIMHPPENLVGYAKSMELQVSKLVYHGIAEAFEAVHLAAETVVDFVHCRDRGPIFSDRSFGGVRIFVPHSVDRQEIEGFLARQRDKDERFLRAAELLGIFLGIVAGWGTGPLGAASVIVSITKRLPEIFELARELEHS